MSTTGRSSLMRWLIGDSDAVTEQLLDVGEAFFDSALILADTVPFFFLCVFSCRCKLNLVRNPLEHMEHVNGFLIGGGEILFNILLERTHAQSLMISMHNLMRFQLPLILESHATLGTLRFMVFSFFNDFLVKG